MPPRCRGHGAQAGGECRRRSQGEVAISTGNDVVCMTCVCGLAAAAMARKRGAALTPQQTRMCNPTSSQVRTLREIEPMIADKYGPGLDGKVRSRMHSHAGCRWRYNSSLAASPQEKAATACTTPELGLAKPEPHRPHGHTHNAHIHSNTHSSRRLRSCWGARSTCRTRWGGGSHTQSRVLVCVYQGACHAVGIK